jgi:small subunit ribosomal protein S2
MINVSLRSLLEAGVHFGHQTGRWNPKMKPFIFAKRNGIYIIDLQKTQNALNTALQFLEEEAAQGGKVLFVGTKRQAQEIVAEEAQRCGASYVNHRWLGGLLTNFQTISKSLERFRELEAMSNDGRFELLTKKEVLMLRREMDKLERNLAGIKNMGGLPDVVFVIDIRRERIAVDEALRLGIPVVAVVDTNCDPDGIDYVIPGNDDALRSIRLFCKDAADAVLSGRGTYEANQADKRREAEEKKAAAKKESSDAEDQAQEPEPAAEAAVQEAEPVAEPEAAEAVEAPPAPETQKVEAAAAETTDEPEPAADDSDGSGGEDEDKN